MPIKSLVRSATSIGETLTYSLGQAARVGWYYSVYQTAARLAPPVELPGRVSPEAFPDLQTILADVRTLFLQDLANIRSGAYRLPERLRRPRPIDAMRRTAEFFADLPAVHLRRRDKRHQEVARQPGAYPRYFRQNFHYQTDGYLSERSADLYDMQVETLFLGAADAMRRQILPPLRQSLAGINQPAIADIGCGNGRFLDEIAANMTDARLLGIDLSLPYLRRARQSGHPVIQANAERLPLADGGLDAAVSVFMFHELPALARRRVIGEIARVLKPGGVFILLDSLQYGDRPNYDPLLDRFPEGFHEPYYAEYCRADLCGWLAAAGLTVVDTELVFLSKRIVACKPGAATTS